MAGDGSERQAGRTQGPDAGALSSVGRGDLILFWEADAGFHPGKHRDPHTPMESHGAERVRGELEPD